MISNVNPSHGSRTMAHQYKGECALPYKVSIRSLVRKFGRTVEMSYLLYKGTTSLHHIPVITLHYIAT